MYLNLDNRYSTRISNKEYLFEFDDTLTYHNAELIRTTFPQTAYNITTDINETDINVATGDDLVISAGIYTPQEILIIINAISANYSATFNDETQRITISNSVENFNLAFGDNPELAYLLGFPATNLSGAQTYTGSYVPNANNLYVNVRVDEFEKSILSYDATNNIYYRYTYSVPCYQNKQEYTIYENQGISQKASISHAFSSLRVFLDKDLNNARWNILLKLT